MILRTFILKEIKQIPKLEKYCLFFKSYADITLSNFNIYFYESFFIQESIICMTLCVIEKQPSY